VSVNAVVYFRVINPLLAVVEVENYLYATSQLAQTTLRSVLGEAELDDLLSERDKLNARLQEILDKHTDPWGIKVSQVEIKAVDLPQEMRRAMSRQAEAEREKRAKIIHAEGEYQASERLLAAARIIAVEPVAVQLRYLQTLTEIGVEQNTTVVFPIPLDMIKAFFNVNATRAEVAVPDQPTRKPETRNQDEQQTSHSNLHHRRRVVAGRVLGRAVRRKTRHGCQHKSIRSGSSRRPTGGPRQAIFNQRQHIRPGCG
jgi:hypothetical protein